MRGRALVMPVLSAILGVVVLAIAVAMDQAVSLGGLLGVLLLLSAAVRLELARRSE